MNKHFYAGTEFECTGHTIDMFKGVAKVVEAQPANDVLIVDVREGNLVRRARWAISSVIDNFEKGTYKFILDEFTKGYLEAILFTEHDYEKDEEPSLDKNFSLKDFSPSALQASVQDCLDFQIAQAEELEKYYEEADRDDAGSDFWLSRNGHGAGFFDRNFNTLQDAARIYGGVYVYVAEEQIFIQ